MNQAVYERLEQLASALELAPVQADKAASLVDVALRPAFRAGFLDAVVRDAAAEIRRLLVTE